MPLDDLPAHRLNDNRPFTRSGQHPVFLTVVRCFAVIALIAPSLTNAAQTCRKPVQKADQPQVCRSGQSSRFVCLSRWLLDSSFTPYTRGYSAGSFFDIEISSDLPDFQFTAQKDAVGQTISIRPLHIVSEPWSSLFTLPHTPQPLQKFAHAERSFSALTGNPFPQRSLPTTTWSQGFDNIDYTVTDNQASFAYQYPMNKTASFNAGLAWVHNLGHMTRMPDVLEEDDGNVLGSAPGVNVSLGARYRTVSLTGGYIRALDTRHLNEFTRIGTEHEPVAWNSELAYQTDFLQHETTLSVGYLRSSDSLYSVLPERRYSTRASVTLFDSTVLSLEYYQDSNLSMENQAENSHGFTTRLGFDF
ncbi:MAG: hypothetical protein GXY53_06210 [Desulfobulbus sp.]|nr:hypothetical protein [Desulfobulbus sp.]